MDLDEYGAYDAQSDDIRASAELSEPESEKRYMKDPMSNTVDGFARGLYILSKYMKENSNTKYFCGAEHDIIYIYTENAPDPESPEGLRLSELGFHWNEDCEGYAYFT
jgi:hypothetical protein